MYITTISGRTNGSNSKSVSVTTHKMDGSIPTYSLFGLNELDIKPVNPNGSTEPWAILPSLFTTPQSFRRVGI
jgi:hypothetical protein